MEEFLCVSDLCDYLKISKSSVHKLSSAKAIPTYKPGGKLIYFKKSEVNAYLERNRTPSIDEIKSRTLNGLYKLKKE